MQYTQRMKEWLLLDEDTKQELLKIIDEKELEDRFYKDLQFGTGGLRGIMGAGPNRMNKYTVGKATLGLANYLLENFSGEKRVVIAYDSRNHSSEFAKDVAQVLAAKGITAYIFTQIMPTPVLSFAVKHLRCTAGIVITASHNPKEYNGYKVYDQNGCQLVPKYADQVIAYINRISDVRAVPRLDFEVAKCSGLVQEVGEEVLEAFLAAVRTQSLYSAPSDLKVVYTPLHGTGNVPVRRILSAYDVVLGTDPDCDRVGIAVRHKDDYVLMSGNQVGALLVDFVLRFKKDTVNEKSTLVKTIVTNDLGAQIGRKHGLQVVETLTGFKYIGDCINRYEQGGNNKFVIGYEESYGYLVGTHARDKDAVVASMLICETAAYHKAHGKTLVDALAELYQEYGFYRDALDSFTLKGKDGAQRIRDIMSAFRTAGSAAFPQVVQVIDYAEGVGDLPKENVLKFVFESGSWLAIRPSGTEPKLKVYYSVRGKNEAKADSDLEALRDNIRKTLGE